MNNYPVPPKLFTKVKREFPAQALIGTSIIGKGTFGRLWKTRIDSELYSHVDTIAFEVSPDAFPSVPVVIKQIRPFVGELYDDAYTRTKKEADFLCRAHEDWSRYILTFWTFEFFAIVMPDQTGDNLEKFAESGALTLQILSTLSQLIIDAILAIHKKGIIHLDIKPNNIMITNENDSLHVRIIDFGLAQNIGENTEQVTVDPQYDYYAHISSDRKTPPGSHAWAIPAQPRHDFFSAAVTIGLVFSHVNIGSSLEKYEISEKIKQVQKKYNQKFECEDDVSPLRALSACFNERRQSYEKAPHLQENREDLIFPIDL